MKTTEDIQVRIDEGRQHAFLYLSGRLTPEIVTAALVTDVARSAGVAFDKDVMARVEAAVADYAANPREMNAEIAVARPPTAPTDGAIGWLPQFDPEATESVDVNGCVDHYAGRRLVAVRPGDVVAKMRRMADGADGRDVTGRVLKPRSPRPCPTKLGRGLTVDAEGRVIADHSGVLEVENDTVKVSDHMHVSGDVDFNTGHVDFTGSVSVSGGVKPCFSVKATGDVQIGGLVEDAITNCGGNLECRRGMTAKDRGEMTVGRNAQAVFLNCMHGVIGGNLTVLREIMNCQLEVRGDVTSPRAVILGGRNTLHASADVDQLGSEKWRETDLVLGWSVRGAIDKRITEINAEVATKKSMHDQIKALGKRATASQRESLTEIEFQLWELEQELAKRKAELERHIEVVQQPFEHSTRSIVVQKWIYPKVRIHLGGDAITFSAPVRGPIRITMDAKDHLMGAIDGGEPRLLGEIARGIGARKAA